MRVTEEKARLAYLCQIKALVQVNSKAKALSFWGCGLKIVNGVVYGLAGWCVFFGVFWALALHFRHPFGAFARSEAGVGT